MIRHIDEILASETNDRSNDEYVVTGAQVWDHMRRHGYLLSGFRSFQREVPMVKPDGLAADVCMDSEYYAHDVAEWLE